MIEKAKDWDDQAEPIAPSFWGNSPGERTLWLALGYMEGAALLAKELVEDNFSRQYRSSRVVLYLTHHAIELFLKGALMEMGIQPQAHHRITELHTDYKQAYAGGEFDLSIPFELPVPETEALFPEIALPSPKSLNDEAFRYATARNGRCFNFREEYDPEMRQTQLDALNLQMNQLFFRLREFHGRPFGPK